MRSIFLLIFFFLVEGTLAQEPILYEVSFENANHHEAVVKVHFKKVTGTPLQIRMSRTSPGRYALHEFAKNVYNFNATDSKGKRLDVSRPNPHQWNVSGHDGEVIVTYTIFGARTDGTYLGIDNTHAHMNIPATFIWARGYEDRPIEITFKKPDDWSVATQLVPTERFDFGSNFPANVFKRHHFKFRIFLQGKLCCFFNTIIFKFDLDFVFRFKLFEKILQRVFVRDGSCIDF